MRLTGQKWVSGFAELAITGILVIFSRLLRKGFYKIVSIFTLTLFFGAAIFLYFTTTKDLEPGYINTSNSNFE